MKRLLETVRVGTTQACVLHGHPKKAGSTTDKPAGTPIKCYPFSGEGGRAGAIKRAYAQHYAIQKSQGESRLTDDIVKASHLLAKMGYGLGPAIQYKHGDKLTSYEIIKPDGLKTTMTTKEIGKLINSRLEKAIRDSDELIGTFAYMTKPIVKKDNEMEGDI